MKNKSSLAFLFLLVFVFGINAQDSTATYSQKDSIIHISYEEIGWIPPASGQSVIERIKKDAPPIFSSGRATEGSIIESRDKIYLVLEEEITRFRF